MMDGQALRESALAQMDDDERQLADIALGAFGLSWEQLAHDARRCARHALELAEQSTLSGDDLVQAVAIGAYSQATFLTLGHVLERSDA